VTSPVTATHHDGVLVVRLTNPAGRNAIGMPFATALHDALSVDLSGVGAIAVLADGDQFCVGGDVRAMAAAQDRGAFIQELADELHKSMRLLPTAPPVVVGVRGWAAGAGMSLVCACDVVIAGESAAFQPAYPGIGVTPDGGMSWNLPRIVGERRARSLLLRNAVIKVAQALDWGLVDEIVADEDVEATVLELAGRLASGPREALAGAKKLAVEGATRPYGDHLDAEAASIAARAASPDGAEGIAAFVERRPARFGTQPGLSRATDQQPR